MSMDAGDKKDNVVVIGGGFTGLSAAYELARLGVTVTVLERDDRVGGMAGSANKRGMDKFYHHFFTSDEHLINLATEIGLAPQLRYSATKTSIYVNGKLYRLSSPADLLRFGPLGLADRVRLAMLVLRSGKLSDWELLESQTAEQWLVSQCGRRVYSVMWEPLLRAKFGILAGEVSAVWFWNKLALRGCSRNKAGREVLGCLGNGFGSFALALADKIKGLGVKALTGKPAKSLVIENGFVRGVRTPEGTIEARAVIATTALPVIADLLDGSATTEYINGLRRIKYMANVCLVLELSSRLSDIYWLCINDPDIPFTGVVEHTNLASAEHFGGRHIVYLSKYLEPDDRIYKMNAEELLEFSIPPLKRIFSGFRREQVLDYHIFKEAFAQPVIERNYSRLICPAETPVKGLYIATMAQVYPQDRGVNYAVSQGRQAANTVAEYLGYSKSGAEK
jgi:protoporphyrinogen oxidase